MDATARCESNKEEECKFIEEYSRHLETEYCCDETFSLTSATLNAVNERIVEEIIGNTAPSFLAPSLPPSAEVALAAPAVTRQEAAHQEAVRQLHMLEARIQPGFFNPVLFPARQMVMTRAELLSEKPECIQEPSFTFFAYPGTPQEKIQMESSY